MKTLLLALLLASTVCVRAQATTVTPDDLFAAVSIKGPSLSPAGTKVATVVRHVNIAQDRRDGALEINDVATKTARPVTVDRSSVTSPSWSPRGDALVRDIFTRRSQHRLYLQSRRRSH
jgi:dipeptidyl aminopeptidase/acylaminoacyl peptidase